MLWRRSYDTPPPPIDPDDPWAQTGDPRYARLAPEQLPASECLADVVDRMLPYWYDAIVPDLRDGATVLVTAHGNSLRALVKHLDGISDEDIVGLNIPTGIPLVYRLDDELRPDGARRRVPGSGGGGRGRRGRGGAGQAVTDASGPTRLGDLEAADLRELGTVRRGVQRRRRLRLPAGGRGRVPGRRTGSWR